MCGTIYKASAIYNPPIIYVKCYSTQSIAIGIVAKNIATTMRMEAIGIVTIPIEVIFNAL